MPFIFNASIVVQQAVRTGNRDQLTDPMFIAFLMDLDGQEAYPGRDREHDNVPVLFCISKSGRGIYVPQASCEWRPE